MIRPFFSGFSRQDSAGRAEIIVSAEALLQSQAKRLGRTITGPITLVHERPWSLVMRTPTAEGDLFFKASATAQRHEAGAQVALADWRHDCVLRPLDADIPKGWLLLPDGGRRLREVLQADKAAGDATIALQRWEGALTLYAGLQLCTVSNRAYELLAYGLPDRKTDSLALQYDRLLQDRGTLRVGLSDRGLSEDEYARLQALTTSVSEWCRQLAACLIPDALNHGDLHDGNIFAPDLPGNLFHFFDWGDCCVSHPFFSLRTVLVSAENTLGIAEDGSEAERLRDVYLAPWRWAYPQADVDRAYQLAKRLAPISGALTWRAVVNEIADPAVREQYAAPVPSLLQEFLTMADSISR